MADDKRRRADWLTLPEAAERILAAMRPLAAERVELHDALGRTLAEPIVSPIDHPPWDNSAMDGFACRAEDVRGASRAAPIALEVIDDVAAGRFPSRPLGAGQAARIMTGAPVPAGADSVVRLEHTDAWEPVADAPAGGPAARAAGDEAVAGRVRVLDDGDAGRNIRRRGEDLRRGQTVLEAGHMLRAPEIGVLAMLGQAAVAVHRRPRVAILANGDELVGLDAFADVLAGRKIVDSNSHGLAAAVRAAGGEPVMLGIARDTAASIRSRLEAAVGADLLVTTAGASVGDHDLLKDVLEDLGFRLDFWRVRMRPGSPVSFGHLGELPVFGLPGNPVSALVTFEVLVHPALRRLLGRREVQAPTVRVLAAQRIESRPGLTHFLRVCFERGEDGRLLARLTGPQGSGILTSMAAADALLVVPEEAAGLDAGEEGVAIPLAAPDPAQAGRGF